ncbi:MAG: 30S ribosomal protein S7 [Planctomycetota bacterium]
MPRKFKSTRVFLRPDPRFHSKLAQQFINYIMLDGKKNTATSIFYNAMEEIQKRLSDKNPYEVFEQCVNNVKPQIEVRSKRVGGATYQVPTEIKEKRQVTLALRWLLIFSRKRKGKPMYLRLADELTAAYKKEGEAMSKRDNVHKMAEANKAFAHFAYHK